jgi:hypothetical protein
MGRGKAKVHFPAGIASGRYSRALPGMRQRGKVVALIEQLTGDRGVRALPGRVTVLLTLAAVSVRAAVCAPELFMRLQPAALAAVGIVGLGVGLLRAALPKGHVAFWETLWHELTHLVFLAAFGRRAIQLCAAQGNGAVQYEGRGSWVISLAPYCFPLHTAVLMGLSHLAAQNAQWFFHSAVAASYAAFLLTLSEQVHLRQPDITSTGRLFSILVIVQVNLLVGLVVLCHIQGDSDALLGILRDSAIHFHL